MLTRMLVGGLNMPKKTRIRGERRIGGARPALKRATYYLTPDLIKDLKIRAATEGTDTSSLVRAALQSHLGKKH